MTHVTEKEYAIKWDKMRYNTRKKRERDGDRLNNTLSLRLYEYQTSDH